MLKKVILLIAMATASISQAQVQTLNGVYDMKLNIGGTLFNDVMEIKNASLFKFNGSITVPGIFTSPIEQGRIVCRFWSDGCEMSFYIVAKENGKEFNVYYQASFDQYDTGAEFGGKAYLENQVLLGDFILIKRNSTP